MQPLTGWRAVFRAAIIIRRRKEGPTSRPAAFRTMALTIARLLVLLAPVAAFNSPTQTSFATFGNDQTRSLIRSWQPRALSVEGSGAVMTPASTENMKRFVRARIMLEQDPSLGCVACMENSLVVVLTRFSKAEHQVRERTTHPSNPNNSP